MINKSLLFLQGCPSSVRRNIVKDCYLLFFFFFKKSESQTDTKYFAIFILPGMHTLFGLVEGTKCARLQTHFPDVPQIAFAWIMQSESLVQSFHSAIASVRK